MVHSKKLKQTSKQMFRQKPQNTVLRLFAFRQGSVLKGIAGIVFAIVVLTLVNFGGFSKTVIAANPTLNFQARLESASGAIAADGNYNVEFKLYEGGTESGGGTLAWTEGHLNSATEGVSVANGYLTVNLGSVTAFPGSINWDDDLYITMNIGGTGSTATWDGEMTPRLKLTAVPYAFQAESATQLETLQGANSGSLAFDTLTSDRNILLPDEDGTICLQGSANCNFLDQSTADSSYIQLQGSTPGTAQTGNFNISGRAIVGSLRTSSIDTSSASQINIGASNSTGVNIGNTSTNTTTTVNGGLTVKPADGDIEDILDVQDSTGKSLLNVNSQTGDIVLGSNGASGGSFGKTDIGSSTDFGDSDYVNVTRYSTGVTAGQASSIWAYVDAPVDSSPNKKFLMAIYSDSSGSPGSLIATSDEGTLVPGWNQVNISATLSPSTDYWLGYLTHASANGYNNLVYDNGPGGVSYYEPRSYSLGFPGSLSGGTASDQLFSMYVTFTSSDPAMTIKGNGEVGIGTATPSYLLDVQGGTGIVGQFSGRVIGADAVNDDEFVTLGQLNSIGGGVSSLNSLSGALSIQGNSQIAVSTTDPNISLSIQGDSIGDAQLEFDTGQNLTATSTPTFAGLTLNGDLNVTGYVGQDAVNNLSFTSGDGLLRSGSDTNITADSDNGGVGDGTGDINFLIGSANVATILNNGNFGIGDTSPSSLLTVGSTGGFQVNDSGAVQAATGITSSGTIIFSNLTNCDSIDTDATGQLVCGTDEGSGLTVQDAYDNGNVLATTDSRDILFNLADTATDSNFIVNLQGTGSQIKYQDGGVDVFTLSDGGDVLFQNSSDSASAFLVQDAGGTNMFQIDTTSNRVYIGSSTADGAGTLLVFDSKNTSGDPAGVDGSMYYNSALEKFRCYQNGFWANCGTLPSTSYFQDSNGVTLSDSNTDLWNNSIYPNLTINDDSNSVLVSVVMYGQGVDNQEEYDVFTIHRAVGTDPTCSDPQVGTGFTAFTTNNNSPLGSSATFADSPGSTGNVRYTVCSSTAGTSVNNEINVITVTLQESGS